MDDVRAPIDIRSTRFMDKLRPLFAVATWLTTQKKPIVTGYSATFDSAVAGTQSKWAKLR